MKISELAEAQILNDHDSKYNSYMLLCYNDGTVGSENESMKISLSNLAVTLAPDNAVVYESGRLYAGNSMLVALEDIVTTDDLANYASQNDLVNFASQNDLVNFASQSDLSGYVTQNYLTTQLAMYDSTLNDNYYNKLDLESCLMVVSSGTGISFSSGIIEICPVSDSSNIVHVMNASTINGCFPLVGEITGDVLTFYKYDNENNYQLHELGTVQLVVTPSDPS